MITARCLASRPQLLRRRRFLYFWQSLLVCDFCYQWRRVVLSPASVVQSCSGSNSENMTIPVGPSGTTARKIYRTRANALATDTPFYVVSKQITGQQVMLMARLMLRRHAFHEWRSQRPTLTRAEGSRVSNRWSTNSALGTLAGYDADWNNRVLSRSIS